MSGAWLSAMPIAIQQILTARPNAKPKTMSILAVGSVAFDNIVTPSGRADDVVGGSATYFSLAASYFTQVRVVAVVGEDFTAEHESVLTKRGVDVRGIQHAKGKTFRWGGQYSENLNEAKTDFTELNVFEKFQPRIPEEYKDSEFLFLGNIHPHLQAAVRLELPDVRLTGGDTMNFWIQGANQELRETLRLVNILLINDGEAKMLAKESSLPRAARGRLDSLASILASPSLMRRMLTSRRVSISSWFAP